MSADGLDNPVREAAFHRTAVIRPTGILYPEGGQGTVWPQGLKKMWVKTPRGPLRPTWPTVRLPSRSLSINKIRLAHWGVVPFPRTAPVPPLRLRNSPITGPTPPIQLHQHALETAITFQTSPHQQGLRSNNLLKNMTVTSRWRPVLLQITTIRLTSSHVKICPKLKTSLWIYQPSSKKSKISTKLSPKSSPRSTHQGFFSPQSMILILKSAQGERKSQPKPSRKMARCRCSSPNRPLNIHPH